MSQPGGASSHRGFTINAAGPRDPQTGYPIGGGGARGRIPRTPECRIRRSRGWEPVLDSGPFLDMGNVFTLPSQIWPSFLRVSQPNQAACKVLNSTQPTGTIITPPTGGEVCRFDYFSYAPGLGLRYSTPIGPIRVDFSYNLNPPIFPRYLLQHKHSDSIPFVRRTSAAFQFLFQRGAEFLMLNRGPMPKLLIAFIGGILPPRP